MNSAFGATFCRVCSSGIEPPLPASLGGLPYASSKARRAAA
jgi:hypothetical protein